MSRPGAKTVKAIPLAWRDLLPWTKPGCKTCLGRGINRRVLSKDKRQTSVCGCALKRMGQVQNLVKLKTGQIVAVEPFVAVTEETMVEAEAVAKAEEDKFAAESETDQTLESANE